MSQRNRKLAGVFLLLGLLVAYPAAVSLIYEHWTAGLPRPLLLLFFIIAGIGWAVPAGAAIKWMARPDEDDG